MLFLSDWPESWKNNKAKESISACQEHLLEHDLSTANYPSVKSGTNSKWFKFSYFKTYHSDIFEGLEAIVSSGIKDDPTISKTLEVIGKKSIDGKSWLCEQNINMQLKLEKSEQLSPWLTIRGLKIQKILSN